MSHEQQLSSRLTVAVVLERWPTTVSVFQALQTACVGCAMAPFDTIEDVARIYELDVAMIMRELQMAIADGGSPGADETKRESAE